MACLTAVRNLNGVARVFDQVPVVNAYREVVQQVRPEDIVVVETLIALILMVGQEVGGNPGVAFSAGVGGGEIAAEKPADGLLSLKT